MKNKEIKIVFFINLICLFISISWLGINNLFSILLSIVALIICILDMDLTLILMIFTIFIENDSLSLNLFNCRIRIVQLLTVILSISFVINLFMKRNKLIILKPFKYLILYWCINIIALINAPNITRSFKILILNLVNMALLFLLIQLINSKNFIKYNKIFMYSIIVQLILGLYQFVCGVIISSGKNMKVFPNGISNNVGLSGVVWGRPYGTLPEPDYWGLLIAMLILIMLYYNFFKKLVNYKIALVTSILLNFICMVRASWIGFIISIIFTALCLKINNVKLQTVVKMKKLAVIIGFCIIIVSILNFSIINDISRRIVEIGTTNFEESDARYINLVQGMKIFKSSPILGYGPAAYNELGIITYSYDGDAEPYNGNIILTFLDDSGALGFIMFGLFYISYVTYILTALKKANNIQLKKICLSYFVAINCMFISYLFTSGLWLPYTWMFLGFSLKSAQLCRTI